MSTGSKLPLAEAARIAAVWVARLALLCDRVELAGSIRRRKPEVGDVEICAIAPQVPSDPRYVGLGGHYYVVSRNRHAICAVADLLHRSHAGVYCRRDLGVWAMRVRRQEDKDTLKRHFAATALEKDETARGGVAR